MKLDKCGEGNRAFECPSCCGCECAIAEIERLTAENAKFRGCLEYIAKPVTERNGVVGPSEAHIRAAAARDVLDQQTITLSEPTPEQEAYLQQIETASNQQLSVNSEEVK